MAENPEIEYQMVTAFSADGVAEALNKRVKLFWGPVAYAIDPKLGFHHVIVARRTQEVAAHLEWYKAQVQDGAFDEVPELKQEAEELLRRFGWLK